MKLSSFLLFYPLITYAMPQPDTNNSVDFPSHVPGEGNVVGNFYMHTLGHVVSDIPNYLTILARGDVVGFVQTILKFALYHNPINLLSDFGGGQILKAVSGGN